MSDNKERKGVQVAGEIVGVVLTCAGLVIILGLAWRLAQWVWGI